MPETTTTKVTTTAPVQQVPIPVPVPSPATPPTPGEAPIKTYTKKKAIFRAYQVIWYILAVIEILLVFRIILKALGANPTSGFANLVYVISNPLALPFRGIFQTAVVEGSVFEWSTIIAGFVYALVAYGLVKLFQFVKPTNPQEVAQKVDSQ